MIPLPENQMKILLTSKDVEKYWGLAKSTLDKLRVTGGGPVYIKNGRLVFYTSESIKDWLNPKQKRSTSDNGIEE